MQVNLLMITKGMRFKQTKVIPRQAIPRQVNCGEFNQVGKIFSVYKISDNGLVYCADERSYMKVTATINELNEYFELYESQTIPEGKVYTLEAVKETTKPLVEITTDGIILRLPKGSKGATVALVDDTYIGVAMCGRHDRFDAKRGYKIAKKRAKLAKLEDELKELTMSINPRP